MEVLNLAFLLGQVMAHMELELAMEALLRVSTNSAKLVLGDMVCQTGEFAASF